MKEGLYERKVIVNVVSYESPQKLFEGKKTKKKRKKEEMKMKKIKGRITCLKNQAV